MPCACSVSLRPNGVMTLTYRHEEDHPGNAQEPTNVIDLLQDLASRQTRAVDTRRREVKDRCHQQTDEVPDSADEPDPAPRRVVRDQLSPEHRGTEWDDGEDQHSDVLPSLRRGSQLRRHSESSELVDPGSDPCEHHPADENVHRMRCRTNDHPKTDECGSDDGHVASTDEIRDGTYEWTNRRERKQIGQNEPDPAVSPANITVDVRRHASEEVHRDLRASPYCAAVLAVGTQRMRDGLTEGHCNERHRPTEGHFGFVVVVHAIPVRSEAVLLIVIVVAGDTFVGVDLLDVGAGIFGLVVGVVGSVWTTRCQYEIEWGVHWGTYLGYSARS